MPAAAAGAVVATTVMFNGVIGQTGVRSGWTRHGLSDRQNAMSMVILWFSMGCQRKLQVGGRSLDGQLQGEMAIGAWTIWQSAARNRTSPLAHNCDKSGNPLLSGASRPMRVL